jgi:hypothetical protein
MGIIGIFLDRRVSVDLARAISVILQVPFIVASANEEMMGHIRMGRVNFRAQRTSPLLFSWHKDQSRSPRAMMLR